MTLKAGGSIELIETENFYEVVNVYDNLKNVVKLSNDLNNKGLWWLMPPFVSAIKQVVSQNNIASSINSDLFQVESGVIKCGALANLKNIVNVNVPVGEDLISEIETAYPIGSHVTVFFKATTESILECGGANINGFRSNKWNRFVVKNGSIARFLQQDDGLWLLDGLDISEQWVTPVVPSQVSTISENGALKYKICNDGTIKFEGSVSMAANSAAAVLFTLPRSLFKFPDWTVQKRIFVPSFYGSANGNYTNNNMVYFIDGANVKFQIATDNVSTDFNFQSVIINFR